MLLLLSCAKTMSSRAVSQPPITPTEPLFNSQAKKIALEMLQFTTEELQQQLKVNQQIAAENVYRFMHFLDKSTLMYPAVLGYTGIVFQQLGAKEWDKEMWVKAQKQLRFTSFCYGILRPTDCISPYRLEGTISLPLTKEKDLFHYWQAYTTKALLTDSLAAGGSLINLASGEMRRLFDWKKLTEELTVITPEFLVEKNGKWKQIVVYTKMARGQLARFLLSEENDLPLLDKIKSFHWQGYTYNEALTIERAAKQKKGEILLTFSLSS